MIPRTIRPLALPLFLALGLASPVSAGQPKQLLPPGHTKPVRAVAFHPQGKLLATGGEDGTVRLWETGTWRLRETIQDGDAITQLAFHPDAKTLLWGRKADGLVPVCVRHWDLERRR